jgi:hypothetical protein
MGSLEFISNIALVHQIKLGDMAAWISGIGTLSAAWIAVAQYRKNSQDKARSYRQEQAGKITSWVLDNNGQTAWHVISNQSENPIYEVIVSLVAFQGAGDAIGKTTPINFRRFLSVVPPGTYYVKTDGHSGMSFHPSSCVAFTDTQGVSWLRKGDGGLVELGTQKPMEFYDVPRPIGWELPNKKKPQI